MDAEEIKRLGMWLHEWHESSSDPIYAVGSLLASGKGDQVTQELMTLCYYNLSPDKIGAVDHHRADLIRLRKAFFEWWGEELERRDRELGLNKLYQVTVLDFDRNDQFPVTFLLTNNYPDYMRETFNHLSVYGQPNSRTEKYTSWSFSREYVPAIMMLLIKEGFEPGKLVD